MASTTAWSRKCRMVNWSPGGATPSPVIARSLRRVWCIGRLWEHSIASDWKESHSDALVCRVRRAVVAGPPAVPLAVHLRGPNVRRLLQQLDWTTAPSPPAARPGSAALARRASGCRTCKTTSSNRRPTDTRLCHTRRRAVKRTSLGTGKEREAGRGVWPSFLLLLCKRVPKLGRAVVLDALLENENAAWSARESETLLHTQRASSPPQGPLQ